MGRKTAAGTVAGVTLQQSRLAITFSSRMVKGKVVATLSCAAMIFPRLGETCFVSASPAAQQPLLQPVHTLLLQLLAIYLRSNLIKILSYIICSSTHNSNSARECCTCPPQ